jgi:hypothetical protein
MVAELKILRANTSNLFKVSRGQEEKRRSSLTVCMGREEGRTERLQKHKV